MKSATRRRRWHLAAGLLPRSIIACGSRRTRFLLRPRAHSLRYAMQAPAPERLQDLQAAVTLRKAVPTHLMGPRTQEMWPRTHSIGLRTPCAVTRLCAASSTAVPYFATMQGEGPRAPLSSYSRLVPRQSATRLRGHPQISPGRPKPGWATSTSRARRLAPATLGQLRPVYVAARLLRRSWVQTRWARSSGAAAPPAVPRVSWPRRSPTEEPLRRARATRMTPYCWRSPARATCSHPPPLRPRRTPSSSACSRPRWCTAAARIRSTSCS
mmetsp:Transcript_37257/g.81920  ORF Transcript_37257/g.81920 Transcript_37257/m.81920 type:complete len:269 (+) Transcript_37257:2595-3401(+)